MKKKILSLALASTSLLTLLASCGGDNTSGNGVVNVYNWGEYIDMSVLDDFEAATGIKVNYQTYDSNEALYGKLAGGATGYDVIIPSDYMIGQMIEEDMLEPLNFDNIPNFADVDPTLKNPEYDPENLYSVPYMYGILGIIYNTTMVDPNEDMETWDPDLAFALPREGTNRYVDAMCIIKDAENKENAEAFINFMCSTEAGLKNCEEIWYSSPLLSVREELDPEVKNDPFAYPDKSFMEEQCETFACLPADIRQLYNDEWVRLLNS